LTLAGWRATGGRQALLPGALRGLHQGVLRQFLTHGRAPDRAWIQKQAAGLGLDAARAIQQLTAADLVHLGADGVVSVAYPFSGVPRGHQVQLAGGPTVQAMCAIDALGIPPMADRDATITAADPATGDEVTVQARAGTWHWAPASTVVLAARTGANGPSVECTCDHMNFYSHAEHAQNYLDEHPELTGQILDHDTAIARAAGAFGALLRDQEPTEPEAPTAGTGGPSQ
jgi:alkylmercury lyase